MVRAMGALLAGLLLTQAGAAAPPTPRPGRLLETDLPFQGASWLIKLESKDGKYTGTAFPAQKRQTPKWRT